MLLSSLLRLCDMLRLTLELVISKLLDKAAAYAYFQTSTFDLELLILSLRVIIYKSNQKE